jgi:hypothetical protein
MNPTMDAVYILSPLPHIVDCLLADFDRRRYRRSFLVWTGVLDPQLRRRIDSSPAARELKAGFETLSIDFYPRETHLITFRDPWSFPILYHPACNHLVRDHMVAMAQKVRSPDPATFLVSNSLSRPVRNCAKNAWPVEGPRLTYPYLGHRNMRHLGRVPQSSIL